MDTQEQLSAHNNPHYQKSSSQAISLIDLSEKDQAIGAIEHHLEAIKWVDPDDFSPEDFYEICMKGALADGNILPYLSQITPLKDYLTREIIDAAYLHSAVRPAIIYPNTIRYLTLDIAAEMLNQNIANLYSIPDLNMLLEALHRTDALFKPDTLSRIAETGLFQQAKQIITEEGWDKNHPAFSSYLEFNNKLIKINDNETTLPQESIADIWNTLSDKDIAQLKRDFHIEHAPFDVQLNNTERWRLEEMVINRYEDHHSMLQRLNKYESLYPGLPAVANTLVLLINACNNPASQQAVCDLLSVHLRYAGLMKNCPDYNLLANEALQNGWLGDELCNKQTLYNKIISCTEKLAEQKRVEVFDSLRNQQEKTQRQDRSGESETGRRR